MSLQASEDIPKENCHLCLGGFIIMSLAVGGKSGVTCWDDIAASQGALSPHRAL